MMTKNRFFSLNEARRFLALGLPVLVTQIAQMGMNFVDTAMTGQASTADMAWPSRAPSGCRFPCWAWAAFCPCPP